MMADKPIIFSAPMVRALRDRLKTQTRRVLKPQPGDLDMAFQMGDGSWHVTDSQGCHMSPLNTRYAPGDRLWVRETWTARMTHGWTISDARSRMFDEEILYRADGHYSLDGWWSSIHMPREFSRLTLTVTDVRVQRLGEISAADSIAEGVQCGTCEFMNTSACNGRGCFASIAAFQALWNSLHGPDAWDANPWVAAYTFTVERANIDAKGGPA